MNASITCLHIELEFIEMDKNDLMIQRCINCSLRFYVILCEIKEIEPLTKCKYCKNNFELENPKGPEDDFVCDHCILEQDIAEREQ